MSAAAAPARWVALLRGINVGGHRKVPMAELRSVLGDLGFGDVSTYVQSGNVVFTAKGRADALATKIESAIESTFGFDVSVLVRSASELDALIDANPYADEAASDPTRVHAVFLSADVDRARLDALDLDRFSPDELTAGRQVLYLHLPNGLGRSKLAALLTDKRLGVTATARNWRTVETLAELVAG